jgi:hypothetical protein
MPKPKMKFCSCGHDISVVGRKKDGRCAKCRDDYNSEYMPRHYIENKEHILSQEAGYREKNKDKEVIRHRKYREDNKESIALANKIYYQIHKDEIQAYLRAWSNKNREKVREYGRMYRKLHPEIFRLASLKTNTKRVLRFVLWGQEGILEFYHNTPKSLSVDHIIPLQGRFVSGLHVSWNLQYLSISKNSSKGNRIDLVWASEWYGKILEEAGLK